MKSINAIYDNGNIKLLAKKIPKIKSKVKIIFEENIKNIKQSSSRNKKAKKKIDFRKLKVCGIWKDRAVIKSGVDYVNKLRQNWS